MKVALPNSNAFHHLGSLSSISCVFLLWSGLYAILGSAEVPVDWNSVHFSAAISLTQLPAALRAELGAIADRDQEFNSTDIMSITLPMYRFVLGGVSEDAVLVVLESGGWNHRFEAIGYTREQGHWLEVELWTLGSREPLSLRELLTAIKVTAPIYNFPGLKLRPAQPP